MAQGAIQSQMKIQSHMKRSDSDPGVYSKFESKTSPQDSGADSILRRCFRSLYLTLFPANLIVDRLQRRQATLSPSGEKAEMMEGRCWILRSRRASYGQFFAAGFARKGPAGVEWHKRHGNEICSRKLDTIGRYKSLLHRCVDLNDPFWFLTGGSAVRK